MRRVSCRRSILGLRSVIAKTMGQSLGVTGGDVTKTGYYAGIIVSIALDTVRQYTDASLPFRSLCSMQPKL